MKMVCCSSKSYVLFRFQPVTLQIQYLCQLTTVGEIQDELKVIHLRMNDKYMLDELYDRAITKLKAQHSGKRKLALEILKWSTSAKRTLTVPEISIILELVIRPDSNETNKHYQPDSETILEVCASLIKIDDVSGQVRMHATVFEYIIRKMPELRQGCDCAIACTKYLSFKPFSQEASGTQEDFNDRRIAYPFLDYAARYLESHVVDHKKPSEQLVAAILKLVKQPGNRDSYFQAACADQTDTKGFDWYPKLSTPLHAASRIGCPQVVSTLIREKDSAPVATPDSKGQTALHVASIHGHSKICEILLQNKAPPSVVDRYGWTPLCWAVKEGHGNVAEVLLSRRERRKELLSAKTNLGDSVLHLAAINGDLNIAHLLIQEGAELDLKNNDGETPLSIAQREKNVQMANIFIAAADIKGKESSTTSPLFGLLVNGFQTLAERISSRHEILDKRISGTHSPIHVQ
jgi:hypothetical protein